MQSSRPAPRSGESMWLWLFKILSGLAIVLLLAVHLVVNHFIAEGGLLSHADVVEYYRSIWIVVMEAAFLLLVVSHSLIGLRTILLDLKPGRRLLRAADFVLILVGVGSTIYGLWLLQAVVRQG